MSIPGKQNINIGLPNEPTGSDSLYDAFTKAKVNFDTLFSCASPYNTFTASSGISVDTNANAGVVTITNTGVTALTAGTGIILSGSNGNITISSTGSGGNGGGTVTSVGVLPVSGSRLTVTGSPIVSSGNIFLDLATTGVTAGTYNNPIVTVDSYGRVISMSNGAIAGTVTSVGITPGPGIQINGGPITSNGNITVTNSGVTRLTAGSGINLSSGNGNVTISATSLGGTVTSVGVSSSQLVVTGSPVVNSGTIEINLPNNVAFSGNVGAGNIKTDNLLYANGDPYTIDSFLSDDGTTTDITANTISVINLPEETRIGPISEFLFDTTHNHTSNTTGVLCWNDDDDTLNINHSGGVVQQVGQELYGYVRNNTGNTIVNGTCVRFDGAEQDGQARLEVAPFLANGTFPSLYALGIATQDIADGEDGRVTVWGKVRNIDASGNAVSQTWNVGDILYANPNEAGLLTNVKPTAPDNVIPIATVLSNNAVTGELFVRPTIEQSMSYGKFELTSDLSVSQTNTANVILFDSTEIANGVERVVGNTSRLQVNQSGLYQIDVSAQIDASGGGFGSATMYIWVRKNGTDVPDSTRRQGVLDSAPSATMAFTLPISLDANDYIEIAYAGDDTSLRFDSATATAFAPSTAAVKVGVTQIQL